MMTNKNYFSPAEMINIVDYYLNNTTFYDYKKIAQMIDSNSSFYKIINPDNKIFKTMPCLFAETSMENMSPNTYNELQSSFAKLLSSFAPDEFRTLLMEFKFKYGIFNKLKSIYDNSVVDCIKNSNDTMSFLKNFYNHKSALECEYGAKNISYFTKDMSENNIRYLIAMLFCELIFDDFFDNFKIQREELMIFLHDYKSKLSNQQFSFFSQSVGLFEMIKKVDVNNFDKIREIFLNAYKNKTKIQHALYDAKQIAREISSKDYYDSISKLNSFPNKLVNGVKVIDTRGKKYAFFVNSVKYETNLKNKTASQIYDSYYFDHFDGRDSVSLCYIRDDCPYTFKDMQHTLTFGFNSFDPKRIIGMCDYDNYSEYVLDSDEPLTKNREFFGKPDTMAENLNQLIKNGKPAYSEFNILSVSDSSRQKHQLNYGEEFMKANKKLEPDFIVCVEEPTQTHLELAKLMNLPLVIISSKNLNFYGEMSDGLLKYRSSL